MPSCTSVSGGGGGVGRNSLYDGLYIEGSPSNQRNADIVVGSLREVLDDFGFSNALTGIYFSDKQTTHGAGVNGFGRLTINNNSLKANNNDNSGWLAAPTHEGTGAHEAGHIVANQLLRQVMPQGSVLEVATARSKNKIEKAIIKEAKRRYGSNPAISGYGSTNVGEKIAEAVSDVYTNKSKANPYSKVIVDVMKDIKKKKFTPVIKVSKSEMGIR